MASFLGRALAKSPLITPALSQQPVPEQLRIQVSRVSMHDYDALHYDKEQLKEACKQHAGLEGWGGGGAAEEPESPKGRAAGCSRLLTTCSVFQPCHWALWWSQETVTSSSAAPTSRGSSR